MQKAPRIVGWISKNVNMLARAVVMLSVAGGVASGQGSEPTVASAPPVVVKTVPEAGSVDVDPATAQIRVTFSKVMADGSWSWNKSSEGTFPKLAGQPHYEKDRRTCVAPVKLEPGKTYAIWLNSPPAQSFRDTAGRPAVPYLLVFATRGTPRVKETRNDAISPTPRATVAIR